MDTFVEIRRYMADTMYLFKQVNNIETRQIESDIKREAFEKAWYVQRIMLIDINEHKMSGFFNDKPIKYTIEGGSAWNGYNQLIRQ